MGESSVTNHRSLLEATAARFRKVFGEAAMRTEAAIRMEGAAPQARHESLRSRLESRSPFELLRANPAAGIEQRLRRLGYTDEVIRGATAAGPALEGRFDSGRIGLERIIGRNELLAVRYLDAGQLAGRAVARVVIRSGSGAELGYGTGSMISPVLLMTNNHVLNSAHSANSSVIEFNYQLGLNGRELSPVRFRLRPDLFFTTSPQEELDVTIVAVDEMPISQAGLLLAGFGFNPLSADQGEILAGESVTVIQHPGGDLKQIALRENRVLRFPNTGDRFLYYETDTTPGSSGAPVFNDQWEVVALHHSGFPERDSQGRILTTDGQTWHEEMGDERIHWIANEGIRVVAIRQLLSDLSSLSSAQGALRDRALNPQPIPPGSGPDERKPSTLQSGSLPVTNVGQPSLAGGSTAVWNIPLTISVTLGNPAAGASSPVIITGTSTQPSPHSLPPGSNGLVDEPADADFDAARKEFAEAATRPYFDAAADQADRTAYYAGVSTTLSPSRLFDALSQLVSSTHNNKLGYKPMLHLYPWVDLQPNRTIRSVYSTQTFDPVEFISRDAEVARLRRERVSRFRTTEAAANPILEAVFLESLEADLPYNCEHVVPQSWFQKRQPMKGDLHHLFACESRCNSFRSNTPYFDFTDFREAVRSDCGKSETNKFEPNDGKGAVARATLYFLVRYPGEINSTSSEYTPERLQTLLQWHQDHPVTDYERHRNQTIFAAQGNRNPFVDHPEWATVVNVALGLG